MNTMDILKTHNAWRRGDDPRSMDGLGFSVTELGIAIDDAVRAIAERDQLRVELEECTRAWALRTAELAKERERVKQAMEIVKAVAHIGIDFGYGVFELEPTHIDQARKLYDSALSAGEGEAVADDAFAGEFAEWWEEHGQFVRSGGGNYERFFAFEAWRYLYPRTLSPPPSAKVPEGGQ